MKNLVLGVASLCLALPSMAQETPKAAGGVSGVSPEIIMKRPARPSKIHVVPGGLSRTEVGISSQPGSSATVSVTTTPTPPSSPNAVVVEGLGAAKNIRHRYSANAGRVGTVSVEGSNINITQDKQEQADDPVKTKNYSHAYKMDRNDKLNLSNSYGSVTVKTWDRNEIRIDADIKAFANTEDEAQKLLDGVTVKASKEGNQVIYKAGVSERSGSWGRGSINGRRWRREVKIHLTVFMPKNNALNVSQEYGNILMDDFNGPTLLKVQYGSLKGGDLNNANNYIAAEYSSTRFNNVNQIKIRQEYGAGLTIGTVGTLDLESHYAAVNITTVKNSANIRQEYGGGINIVNANNLTLNAHYIRTKINTLTGNLNARLEYGGFSVDNVETSVKNFNLTSDYTAVNLGFGANYNANFTVNTDYAPFKYGGTVNAKKIGEDKSYSTSKSYAGQIGKGGNANVVVKAEYGSVTFK